MRTGDRRPNNAARERLCACDSERWHSTRRPKRHAGPYRSRRRMVEETVMGKHGHAMMVHKAAPITSDLACDDQCGKPGGWNRRNRKRSIRRRSQHDIAAEHHSTRPRRHATPGPRLELVREDGVETVRRRRGWGALSTNRSALVARAGHRETSTRTGHRDAQPQSIHNTQAHAAYQRDSTRSHPSAQKHIRKKPSSLRGAPQSDRREKAESPSGVERYWMKDT
jgi:hypothetical protein